MANNQVVLRQSNAYQNSVEFILIIYNESLKILLS